MRWSFGILGFVHSGRGDRSTDRLRNLKTAFHKRNSNAPRKVNRSGSEDINRVSNQNSRRGTRSGRETGRSRS